METKIVYLCWECLFYFIVKTAVGGFSSWAALWAMKTCNAGRHGSWWKGWVCGWKYAGWSVWWKRWPGIECCILSTSKVFISTSPPNFIYLFFFLKAKEITLCLSETQCLVETHCQNTAKRHQSRFQWGSTVRASGWDLFTRNCPHLLLCRSNYSVNFP